MRPPQKGGGPPKFSAHVYCDQTAGWMKLMLGMVVGLSLGEFVLNGHPAPTSPKTGRAPNFRPMSVVAKRLDGLKCHLVWRFPRPRRLCVRWGPSSPQKKVQTSGCIKMPLGTEVGLSPGNFVVDADPAPPGKGVEPPIFGPRLLWSNGCMDQDVTWYGDRPLPTRHCIGRGPSSPSAKGAQPPNFRPMSVVVKWLDGSRCHLVRR